MKVEFFGTRGSTAICRPDSIKYGGNTTCLRLHSECLPDKQALAVDMGTGFVELSQRLLKEGILNLNVLITHWHHDHTGGMLLAPHTFIPSAEWKIWGPKENDCGPEEVIHSLMRPPFFPVSFKRLRHRFKLYPLEEIGTQVLVIHREAGFHLMPVHAYAKAERDHAKLALGKGRYDIADCLVVKMYRTNHPEYTISYRFEEHPTGEVFVFLTDMENMDGIPLDLLQHVMGADLLVEDCQYTRAVYEARTAGFGHGTPDFCRRLAKRAKVRLLGLTHHDPGASDEAVDDMVRETLDSSDDKDPPVDSADYWLVTRVFACADYMIVEVKR